MPETRLLIGPSGGPGDGSVGIPPLLGISRKEFLSIQTLMLSLSADWTEEFRKYSVQGNILGICEF